MKITGFHFKSWLHLSGQGLFPSFNYGYLLMPPPPFLVTTHIHLPTKLQAKADDHKPLGQVYGYENLYTITELFRNVDQLIT